MTSGGKPDLDIHLHGRALPIEPRIFARASALQTSTPTAFLKDFGMRLIRLLLWGRLSRMMVFEKFDGLACRV